MKLSTKIGGGFGLLILIGVLLWMRHQPGMRHSPERGRGNPPPALELKSAGPERA
jgi:hypothetical protein